MANVFAGSEIVEMGIQIEKNGKDFYETLVGQSKDNKALYTVVLAITVGLFSTNIFGNSFILYSVAPIGWFLIG